MFNPDGSFDDRTQRILREQTMPPQYGRSPAMDAMPAFTLEDLGGIIGTGTHVNSVAETLYAPNRFIDDYIPPKLTWRERLHVIWTDRIVGAWRVLIGKAWAEEY
jgi:hypothetical protein